MKINKKGLQIIKESEGCRLTAYQDPVGIWTIGYGHTAGVKKGQKITEKKAEEYLKKDVAFAEKAVEKWNYKYKWSENEFSALVSFTFNCGAANLNCLLQYGKRTKKVIADKILLYNKAGGKTLRGLTIRRKKERQLFLLK